MFWLWAQKRALKFVSRVMMSMELAEIRETVGDIKVLQLRTTTTLDAFVQESSSLQRGSDEMDQGLNMTHLRVASSSNISDSSSSRSWSFSQANLNHDNILSRLSGHEKKLIGKEQSEHLAQFSSRCRNGRPCNTFSPHAAESFRGAAAFQGCFRQGVQRGFRQQP